MKVIFDTHAYAWWEDDDRRFSRKARTLIEDAGAELLLSAVVTWELATKFRIGKWREAGTLLENLKAGLVEEHLTPLPISLEHARFAGLMAGSHRDPFDRLLAAQARIEGAKLLTADPAFSVFDVDVVW